MKSTVIYYPFNQVKDLVLKVFPGYTGRKDVILRVVEPGHTFRLNTTWSGGSRNEYAIVSRENFQVGQVPNDLGNHFTRLQEGEFVLNNGYLLFEKGYFTGKPKPVTVYVTHADFALLPPSENPEEQLTPSEILALYTFRARKAGYNSETRLQQCNGLCWQNPNPFTQKEWDDLVASLQKRKLLTGPKRIGITTEGKNALAQAGADGQINERELFEARKKCP